MRTHRRDARVVLDGRGVVHQETPMMALLLLLACDGSAGNQPNTDKESDTAIDTDDPCFASDPVLSIGTGETSFKALDDGDELTMVHGPQGGWHILGSVQVANTTDRVVIDFTLTDVETDSQLAANNYYVGLIDQRKCTQIYPGMFAYLTVGTLASGNCDTPPEVLSGRTIRIDMTAKDQTGRTANATLEVVAAPDPKDDTTCQ
jgi:hypothetical protein